MLGDHVSKRIWGTLEAGDVVTILMGPVLHTISGTVSLKFVSNM